MKYVQSKTNGQWRKLKYGLAHIQVEVWEGTMADKFEQLLKSKSIVSGGTHNAKTREEWWYPAYVEEVCPGLPDWKALKKCASLFADAQTAPKGKYVGGPWEKPDAARIRALKLGFKVVSVKTGDGLWVELEKAAKVKKPIVLFNWTPNWVEAKYEGKFIEFPDYDPRCESEAKWGFSKKYTWDCGNPKGGWLKKAAWKNVETKWPCAFKILKNMNFSNAQISQASALVDAKKMTYAKAADEWMKSNAKVVKSWVPDNCGKNKL